MSYILDALRRLEQDKAELIKPADPMQTVLHFHPDTANLSKGGDSRRWNWALFAAVPMLVLVVAVTFWLARRTAPVQALAPAPETSETVGLAKMAKALDPFVPNGETPSVRGASSSATVRSVARVSPSMASDRPANLPQVKQSSLLISEATTRGALPPPNPGLKHVETLQTMEPPQIATPASTVPRSVARPIGLTGSSEIPVAGSETGLKISAIVWSRDAERRFAMVNQKTVHVGDWMDERQVVGILEDAVVFEEAGTRFQVKMRGK